MDFPIFHLDFLNNRTLIAVIAILHVVINHSFAVGGIPLVTLLEHKGYTSEDPRWDKLAYRIMKTFFIITTTLGAMTGVGIWLSASLINPASIASLIRVFFWAWFTEWIVFVTEVVLIMIYYLSWKRSLASPEAKRKHIRVGIGLSIASWITMVLIVAILSFMMDPGSWIERRTLLSGFFNPIYLPQLAFRTALAMIMAGAASLCLIGVYAKTDNPFRLRSSRLVSWWMMGWLPFGVLASWNYWRIVPTAMKQNFGVAISTQAFEQWHSGLVMMMIVAFSLVLLLIIWTTMADESFPVPRFVGVLPFMVLILFLGGFERIREFIRKPYVIGQYMYSNGIRAEDYPLLQKEGLLTHATYAAVKTITPENEILAGREVFKLACTRCHTVNGLNSIRGNLNKMYGKTMPWEADKIAAYIGTLHTSRAYMPPFPGSEAEKQALAKYLVSIQMGGELPGVQSEGLVFIGGKE